MSLLLMVLISNAENALRRGCVIVIISVSMPALFVVDIDSVIRAGLFFLCCTLPYVLNVV
jgi:hypothetical protein